MVADTISSPTLVHDIAVVGTRVARTDYLHAARVTQAWAEKRESRYVCVACVNNVMEAYDSPSFRVVTDEADMVVPDGMPVVWALRLLGNSSATRVYGPDLTLVLLEHAQKCGLRVGFYGGTPEVLNKLAVNVRRQFPALDIAYMYSPPFRIATAEEDARVTDEINRAEVAVLFVGLGTPKQDYWMAAHRGQIAAVMVGVGAAFDFIAGVKRQAPNWMQANGLEWLFRLCSEPRRLWKRYLKHNPRFVMLLCVQLFRQRVMGLSET